MPFIIAVPDIFGPNHPNGLDVVDDFEFYVFTNGSYMSGSMIGVGESVLNFKVEKTW